ncbi:hypothetical protein BJ138DRAFT_1140434 [Hygrophoropsis aurantiaca]|uniref:Uncharacterized protein n=1 Tax=Hygrophoropsis aurantiaca TaxID=72124 RepID=A0ACB8ASK1_9AGAM|nr:hypothetical protein BJ138DRAFT_1140434 [Hygrophoropsis aurantiaca]
MPRRTPVSLILVFQHLHRPTVLQTLGPMSGCGRKARVNRVLEIFREAQSQRWTSCWMFSTLTTRIQTLQPSAITFISLLAQKPKRFSVC